MRLQGAPLEAISGMSAYLQTMERPIRIVIVALAALCAGCAGDPPDIEPIEPTPSAEQIRYQEMELAGFIHFSINTFTDREWGFGDESPALFAPTDLDVEQWASVAAEAGMGELILTTKHHDGFCLWPSETTDHTVAAEPVAGRGGRPGGGVHRGGSKERP